jgi:hypothetical protein
MLASAAVRARLIAVAVALVALSACGASGSTDLALGWRFADGRGCAEAGVTEVLVSLDGARVGPAVGWPCPDGAGGGAVTVPSVPAAGALLTAEARSAGGAPLYRGDEQLAAPSPARFELPLYFTGGR